MPDPDGWLDLGGGARCGLWWSQSPLGSGGLGGSRGSGDSGTSFASPAPIGPRGPLGPIGRIGRLEAPEAMAASRLLKQACTALQRQGCCVVLAPMEESTWEPYRLLEPDQSPAPAFSGESVHPPHWYPWLEAAGFRPWIRYVSTLAGDLSERRPGATFPGLRLQPLDAPAALARLEPLHQLVMEGFRHQPLFQPLEPAAFARMAGPWLERMDPRFSLVACAGDEPVGLLLAHGEGPGPGGLPRVVVRTLVVRPGRRWAGLGRLLLETCHHRAATAGLTAAVHALMVDPGPSRALSRPYAQPFRRYALMGRLLASGADRPPHRFAEPPSNAGVSA